MPIIWNYLLRQYFKVLSLSVFSFIAILLTCRLDVIARFATLGAEGKYLILFTLYQIPYILPIALPVSCLISSMILFQKLSDTHELTALRASGQSLTDIITPLIIASGFLMIFGFFIVSDVATQSHLAVRQLENDLKSVHPLRLLQNTNLMRYKGVFVEAKTSKAENQNEALNDFILAFQNHNTNQIHLIVSPKLQSTETSLQGQNLSIIFSMDSQNRNLYDHFYLENIAHLTSPVHELWNLLNKKIWRLGNDDMTTAFLRYRIMELKKEIQLAQHKKNLSNSLRSLNRLLKKCYIDLFRRISLAFAIFTFTLMGMCFGMDIGRYKTKKGIFSVIALASIYLACFFAAKEMRHLPIAFLLYTTPHLLIMILSFSTLNRLNKGIE